MSDKCGESSDVTINTTDEVSAKDHAFFKQMLDLIPPQFYFDKEAQERLHGCAKRFRAEGEPDDEENSAEARKNRKRAKFDPNALKTVTELQEQLVSAEDAENRKDKKKSKKTKKTRDSTLETSGSVVSMASSYTSLTELQDKLRAKINLVKAKRGALGKEEFIQKKRLARKMSKLKLKMKNKAGKHKQHSAAGTDGKQLSKADKNKVIPSKPVFNKEGNIVFSKFDFTQVKEKTKSEKSGKNYKNLLQKIEKQKEKQKELAQTDQSAAQALKEKSQWQSVLQKAEGVKVKDDPELLKKSIKRKEKLKQKSAKGWEQRQDRTEKRMKEKQDKRKANIKKKKEGRINKKIKKSKKKGHIIPGF